MHLPSHSHYICNSCLKRLAHHRQLRRNVSAQKYSTAAAERLSRPFRLAIIGSGPAGFYAAGRVMKENPKTVIDMYERLPIPFGLVRYGVAPDHPEVKNCEDRFEEIGRSPNFNFIGNITVGHDVALSSMKPHYDAIMFAYGASKDQELGIPGENLPDVISAREFVAWYNGLPGFADLKPKLDLASEAVVVGQGNVALDVTRVLFSNVDKLRKTDMPEYALDILSKSRINSVHVVGRRGPMQGAFTIKEIREIIQMPDVFFHEIPINLFPSDLKALPRPRRRIAELLLKSGQHLSEPDSKQFFLDFLSTPTSFDSLENNSTKLRGITLQPNRYCDPSTFSNPIATTEADPTVGPAFVPAGIAFRSIGYKAVALSGLSSINVPFDDRRGTIPNQFGRVIKADAAPAADLPELRGVVPGCYVAGWVKRGPTGVIASTMEDAFQTADSIVSDFRSGEPLLNGDGESTRLGWQGVKSEMSDSRKRWTSWKDWKRIDDVEKERGARLGKPREKITTIEEMLGVLDGCLIVHA